MIIAYIVTVTAWYLVEREQSLTTMKQRAALPCIILQLVFLPWACGFALQPAFSRTTTRLRDSEEPVEQQLLFPSSQILEFTLTNHKPLGCTVEESLAHPTEKHVFVAKVVEGGFAHKAGLEVGDVLLALSGIFGDITDVVGLGIEQVRSLVTGREESEPLEIRVARGTNVMELHETALVDLCMMPGVNEKEVEECLLTIMSGGYVEDDDEPSFGCDNEEECLLDDMFAMWGEDFPTKTPASETVKEETKEAPTIPPWSSRSSPSGTYIRDPATGEMRNVDAQ